MGDAKSVSLRYWLTRAGEHISGGQMHNLRTTLNYLELGFWMRESGYKMNSRMDKREELFDLVGREVGDREVLYLEFGVHQGRATRYWSKLLTNANSKLHGFDSFEGLPEDWTDTMHRGHFSTGGEIPALDDSRVQFFKGWFNETLPKYDAPDHEVMVVNFDADLYSSTKCIFDHLSSYIVPGTYLYFDEFQFRQDELRAFTEFCSSSNRKFALRGATQLLVNVLFQCIA